MESFIVGSECWKFGSLDMEWPECAVLCGYPWSVLDVPYFTTQTARFKNKNIIEHKTSVFIFPSTTVSKISHSKKQCMKYDLNCTLVFMQSTRYSYQILKNIELSR
jgi:hypothetical protein